MIILPCQLLVHLCLLHLIMVRRMSAMLMVYLILTLAVMLLWWKVLEYLACDFISVYM